MSSKQQQIVDAILARLATITTANGYGTDIGGRVYGNRDDNVPITRPECPCITVKDPTASTLKFEYPKRDHDLTIFIVGWLAGKASPAAARELANDIHKAIGTDDTLGGLALYTVPGDRNIEKETDGDVAAAVKIIMSVHYRTGYWEI